MNLINDLGCEVAFAVLVEKKYNGKIQLKEVMSLIGQIENALKPISEIEICNENNLIAEQKANFAVR